MMAYGYYGEMMGGFGWVWILLVLAVVIVVVVWGTRTRFWSRDRATELTPLEILGGATPLVRSPRQSERLREPFRRRSEHGATGVHADAE